MTAENAVSDIYGTREWIDFDISIQNDLSVSELEDVLRTDADFLHYIGHVDEEGIRCRDGWLDVADLDRVEISSFLLNACKSYRQGKELVEKGSLGGIVTVTDVLNKSATKIGRTLSRLLDNGFSLLSALEVLEKESLLASHYLVIGDGNSQICGSKSGTPLMGIIHPNSNRLNIVFHYYPSDNYSMGSIAKPQLDSNTMHYIASGKTRLMSTSRQELNSLFTREDFPISVNSSIYWSHSLSVSNL